MIKYLGSKRALVPLIVACVEAVRGARTVLDLFSGTSRVGHALKARGYRVLANDHNACAATLARCYVQADAEEVLEDARRLVGELNRLPGSPGYFTETFCRRSRFFRPENGERIDAVREAIARKGLDPELEAVVLTALLEAADRVDSTTGVQMAYLKRWAPRAFNPLELRVPDVLPRAVHGKGEATHLDVFEAVGRLEGDVAYIDPPYNQHSYRANYHVWETLVRWDRPEVYGVACKRADTRLERNPFNSRPAFATAMRRLLESVRAPVLIVSFSDEGFLRPAELEAMLQTLHSGKARVAVLETEVPRYVGARIGIYNPKGEKVGRVSHVRNREFLYVVSREDLGLRPAGGVRHTHSASGRERHREERLAEDLGRIPRVGEARTEGPPSGRGERI